DSERPDVERLVRDLGSSNFRVREKAALNLRERGAAVLDVLRTSRANSIDLEMARRIERSIVNIHDNDVGPEVPAAVVRVIALQKPSALTETLLAYLPHADNERV